MGSDITFTLAVTDMPVVPTNSFTSSTPHRRHAPLLCDNSTSLEPCTLALS